jgi:hypothetical protein
MGDNTRRGFRTVLQAIVALIVTGAFDQYVIQILNDLEIENDSAIRSVVGLCLLFLSTLAMNYIEDKTGKSILAPKDRVLGDVAMSQGLGDKNPDAGAGSSG